MIILNIIGACFATLILVGTCAIVFLAIEAMIDEIQNMKKDNLIMTLFVILLTLILVMVCVVPAFAQDEEPPEEVPVEIPDDQNGESIDVPLGDCIGSGCGEPVEVGACLKQKAINYIGKETINLWKESGWTVYDDGSCIFIGVEYDEWGNILSLDETNEDKANWWEYESIFDPDFWNTPIGKEIAEANGIPVSGSQIIADYIESPVDTILVEDIYLGEPLSMEWVE